MNMVGIPEKSQRSLQDDHKNINPQNNKKTTLVQPASNQLFPKYTAYSRQFSEWREKPIWWAMWSKQCTTNKDWREMSLFLMKLQP